MDAIKGMLVFVLKGDSDCTNGGITSKVNKVILVGEGIPEVFTVGEDDVYLKLVKRNLFGSEYIHAEPVGQTKSDVGYMSGGNFIYSCDSRFREHVNKYPIPVHDRSESMSHYMSHD